MKSKFLKKDAFKTQKELDEAVKKQVLQFKQEYPEAKVSRCINGRGVRVIAKFEEKNEILFEELWADIQQYLTAEDVYWMAVRNLNNGRINIIKIYYASGVCCISKSLYDENGLLTGSSKTNFERLSGSGIPNFLKDLKGRKGQIVKEGRSPFTG